jgi:hypothetical protein
MNNDPEKRPAASELKIILGEWSERYPIEMDEEKRIPIPGNYILLLLLLGLIK